MFTGIVEEVGTVEETGVSGRAGTLVISAGRVLEGTAVGDSIAVSGVCQTAVAIQGSRFTVDVMPETLRRSTLGERRPGDPVNLERALAVGGRLGGHIVNGHVDAVGTVRSRRREENAVIFEVTVEPVLTRYIVPKGSVAVDGISLTVVSSAGGMFSVSAIPHTIEETTLSSAGPGTRVNIEVDVLAKYVESLMESGGSPSGLEQSLARGGFMIVPMDE